MKQVTVNSKTCYLLDDIIQWGKGFRLIASIPTMQESGLSAIEARRPLATTLRLSASFSVMLTGSQSVVRFRNSLQLLSTENVICPLWAFQIEAGATPTVTSAYYVVYDASFNATVQAAASAPFTGTAFPAMFGRLENPPQVITITDLKAEAKVSFVENDTSSISLPAFSSALNFNGGFGGSVAVMPFFPNWSKRSESGASEQTIERRILGQQRETADAYYTQISRRNIQSQYTLRDASSFLSFFLATSGNVASFWMPALLSDVSLTADVASSASSITVDDTSQIGTEQFVILSALTTRFPTKITVSSGTVLNVSPSIGSAFPKLSTRVESLLMARFDKNELAVDFSAPGLCSIDCGFTELPYETAAQSGETLGTTFGALPKTAILFSFSMPIPGGGSQVWRFTNYEIDLTFGGNTYSSEPIEFDEITDTAVIERQNVTVTSRNFSGNPVALFVPFTAEQPLALAIYEVDVSGSAGSNSKTLFQGELNSVQTDGPFLIATVASLSSIFDRKIPRRLINSTCNWILFEPKCSLLNSNWTWTGTVTSITGDVLVIGSVTSSNGATLTAHFFSGGFLSIGSGTTVQTRMISDSAAISGGSVIVQLSQPFNVNPSPGDTVTFFPGCDGLSATCINKFNNYVNFGGFPFVPAANPTIFQQTQTAGGGGKK